MIDTMEQVMPMYDGLTPRLYAERIVPRWWYALKRTMDLAIATAGLILTAPILVAAMIAIMMSSPGSPLFAQERVGHYGRRFTLFKLRTMMPEAQFQQEVLRAKNPTRGPAFKMRNDPRVFPVGRILRCTSIDELPNLINVLLGNMSIVGPRPPLPSEVENYGEYAFQRLLVKPGITCLWQISGRSNIDFDQWMDLDHRYIANWSPLYDLRIILLTIPAVLLRTGAY